MEDPKRDSDPWIRVTYRIPISVFKEFKGVCAKNHATMSSTIRQFMIATIADQKRFDATYGYLEEKEVPTTLQSTEISEDI